MENRVVITGIGIHSCIGENLDEVKDSLRDGKCGIVFDPKRKEVGYRSGLTGKVNCPNLKGILDRKLRKVLPEHGIFAFLSTKQALEMSGIDSELLDKEDVGILFGNDSCAQAVIEANDKIREKKDTIMVGSSAVFQTMNSTVSMGLSTIFKLKGINFSLSGACASGSHAIGMGYTLIKHGYQDCIICGGAQEVNIYSMGSFDALAAFSICEDEPFKASRPFDKNRDGLIPSGGAATVIIESLEHAKKRNATILGEVVGYGFSSNGAHISNPTADGPRKAIEMAIQQANISKESIDYVNAHATSTPAGDAAEAMALKKVFEKDMPWISSTKGMTGHECWMAGASEIVYSMLMMQNNFIAPNLNYTEPDEYTKGLRIATERIDMPINTFLSNSFGFGGTNSSLIVKKWNE
ncbi:MAG: beta-ketoacyl synthase [Bacteroidales bacterium]